MSLVNVAGILSSWERNACYTLLKAQCMVIGHPHLFLESTRDLLYDLYLLMPEFSWCLCLHTCLACWDCEWPWVLRPPCAAVSLISNLFLMFYSASSQAWSSWHFARCKIQSQTQTFRLGAISYLWDRCYLHILSCFKMIRSSKLA